MIREFVWKTGPKAKVVLTMTKDEGGETYTLTTRRENAQGRRSVIQRVPGKPEGKANVLWLMHAAYWIHQYGSPNK